MQCVALGAWVQIRAALGASVAGGDGGMARYVGLPATPTHPRPPCTRKATPPPYTL
jgi:hypothetical protein